MIQDRLRALIEQALSDLDYPKAIFNVEHPSDEKNGDFSTNIALILSKQVGKPPREIAQTVKDELDRSSFEDISKIEIAGPGFINFYVSEQFLISEMKTILDLGEKYGLLNIVNKKRIVVEYTDPNPFKEFHVGHLYSNIVGEAIAKLKEASGAVVWRADFFGDVGMHVAKALWGLMRAFADKEISMEKLAARPLGERIEFFGKAYSVGATAYEENAEAKEDMKQINFLAFKAVQEVVLPQHNKAKKVDYERFIRPGKYDYTEIKELYALGRKWSLEYFETIYQRLGTKFDGYYPESLTGEYGYGMVIDALSKGIFEKGDGGAVIFPGEKHGLHNRVFINSLGLPTYEAKDFGNAVAKSVDFPYDESVIVTGNEINEYFNVMLQALRLYKPELGKVTRHIGHGMVRLPEGKMSSRTGKIVRGEDVLNEAVSRVLTLMADRDIPDLEKTAEMIAQGAIKYAFLKQGVGKDIAFDFDSSLSFEGNSGPYLQYTIVRAKAVLEKSKNNTAEIKEGTHHLNEEEILMLKLMYRFPEVISQASSEYAPHLLATYLYELSQRFNSFYTKHSVLSADNAETRRFRLSLVACSVQILTNGLKLLGIRVPERM